jgi:hypothetical protein
MKKNKLINQKDIQTILKHAGHDIPFLEKQVQSASNVVIDLGIKRKELNAQLFDLGQIVDQIKRFSRFQKNIDISKY